MQVKRNLDALIVGALQGDVLHGYAIAQRIRATNEGALRPGEGLVYPVLYRLAADGVVRTEWLSEEGKPARKAYRLAPGDAGRIGSAMGRLLRRGRPKPALQLTDE